jgi:hypothetical protein
MECILLATGNAAMVLELDQGYALTSDGSPTCSYDRTR